MPHGSRQVVIIVGFPYWPGKSLAVRSIQKVALDFKASPLIYWITKAFWNVTYLVIHPRLTVKQWRALHQTDLLAAIPKNAVVIRDQEDAYCTPELAQQIKHEVLVLPGQHDDLWANPQPYIKIIEDAYAQLLA